MLNETTWYCQVTPMLWKLNWLPVSWWVAVQSVDQSYICWNLAIFEITLFQLEIASSKAEAFLPLERHPIQHKIYSPTFIIQKSFENIIAFFHCIIGHLFHEMGSYLRNLEK